jgi:MazG family protein
MGEMTTVGAKFEELVGILARLRGPGGCPWDREQDERAIANYFLEEAYEAVDALFKGDSGALAEELGDVLMEVIFLSRLYEEKGLFTVADALDSINAKMIRRHPHVFGDAQYEDARRVLDAWVKQKTEEKSRARHFEGLASTAPALLAAFQIGVRVAQVGFDWPTAAEALAKVREEMGELEKAFAVGGEAVEEELGDALFALANVARLLKVNPEIALRRANEKFMDRFGALAATFEEMEKPLGQASLAEMDAIWEEVKKQ